MGNDLNVNFRPSEPGLIGGHPPLCIACIGDTIGVADPIQQMVWTMKFTELNHLAELDTLAQWSRPEMPVVILSDQKIIFDIFRRRRQNVHDYTQGYRFQPGVAGADDVLEPRCHSSSGR